MALIHMTGNCECKSLGLCAQCGEVVSYDEDRYEFPDGNVVHDDCMLAFVEDEYYRRGAR